MTLRLIKQVFKVPNLRNRFLVVLGIILLFRMLAHIPIPIGDTATLTDFLRNLFNSNRLFMFVDLFSGGALTNFSIVLLGLGPYINASIIMQLATQAVPTLAALRKEGEQGRQKINQYTRMLTLPLAIGQSIGTIFFIKQLAIQVGQTDIIGNPTLMEWVIMVSVITGGSFLLMWLGELISEKGIGNGISILIFAGIVAQLPGIIGQSVSLLQTDLTKLTTVGLFIAAAALTTYFIVKLNESQRTITVSYAKRVRGSQSYGGVESKLPIRVLTAGVVPIIFAVAFLSVPTFLGQLFANAQTSWLAQLASNFSIWFAPTHWVYAVTYFVLVVAFTYFYTGVVFNTSEISENLQKQGGFIPGIRPGNQTATFLKKIVNRITLFGALSLGLIAILPFIGEWITNSSFLTLGGTSLLIVVSVALETLRQLETLAINTAYQT